METAAELRERFKSHVALDEVTEKRINGILHPCLAVNIQEMRKDPTFKIIFEKLQYNGSCYDKLAVDNSYDFDLIVIFGIKQYHDKYPKNFCCEVERYYEDSLGPSYHRSEA